LASGVVDPAWPVDALAIVVAAGDQSLPAITSDGAGGAIVAWYDFRGADYDIYAQRALATGMVDPAWPANGRALCLAPGHQQPPRLVDDGASGAIVTWSDRRNGLDEQDIYAQRVLASGAIASGWPVNGFAVCTAARVQQQPDLVSDGAGGAVIAWADG